jgi:hypothetical protein
LSKWPESEMDLAATVVDWLKSEGWEVYQEVQLYETVADIVAVKDGVTRIIECKRTFGLDVIAQALSWKFYCHESYVAVPAFNTEPSPSQRRRGLLYRTAPKTRTLAQNILRHYGLGMIEASENRYRPGDIKVERKILAESDLKPDGVKKLLESITEAHKDYCPAGSASGGYITPFSMTCDNIRQYLKEYGQSAIGDIVAEIDHHYTNSKSAVASIRKWASKGSIKGVEAVVNGRTTILRLREEITI